MSTPIMHAYCQGDGVIHYSMEMPRHCLPIAKGHEAALKQLLSNTACQKGELLCVPGMREATTVNDKQAALRSYRGWLAQMLKNEAPEGGGVAVWVNYLSNYTEAHYEQLTYHS